MNLNDIKNGLKDIFDSANTTTGSPIDLSLNLTNRVKKVLTVHPDYIYPQASFFPCVTSYVVEKDIKSDQIGKSQLNTKRRSQVVIEIVGAVFNQNQTDITKDPADNDVNNLMENIEQILRGNYNISGLVNWQKPESVRYYSAQINATNHIRAGVLRLTAEVFY